MNIPFSAVMSRSAGIRGHPGGGYRRSEVFDMSELADDYEGVANLFRALGHPTRLRLIATMRRGELCVQDLGETVERSQPNVSQHLAVLRERGLVTPEREGKQVCYHLADEGVADIIRLAAELCE